MRALASHPVLAVHDLERSAAWYREVLGCEAIEVDPGNWVFCRAGGVTFELGRCPEAPPASAIGDHSYVAAIDVTDVDAYFARAVAAGAEVLKPPTDEPWGRRELALRSPDGHRFMLRAPDGDTFGIAQLEELTELVAAAWTEAADGDWGAPAGTLEWSCLHTADHAVDTVVAPAVFLASRKLDGYGELGPGPILLGDAATPRRLVDALRTASRLLAAAVLDAGPEERAAIWLLPEAEVRPPRDFLPRAGLELLLHGHDVCLGLGQPFEPPAELCRRLREHTREWPMWDRRWGALPRTEDPWGDLLAASGRARAEGGVGR